MLTSKIIDSKPRSPKGPEFPSLWKSALSGTVFLMTGPDKGVRIVGPECGTRSSVGDRFEDIHGPCPVDGYGTFERIDGPLTVEFNPKAP
jgi:hypothetical protein